MAIVAFTSRANLIGGQPENIADVTDCLDKLLAGVNSVAAAQIEAQQAWQTIALPAGLSSGSLAYYKDSLGVVRFRGDKFALTAGGMTTNMTLCTMPAGYRPGATHFGVIHLHTVSPSPLPVSITTAGVMALTDGAQANSGNAVFSLLSYRAEN